MLSHLPSDHTSRLHWLEKRLHLDSYLLLILQIEVILSQSPKAIFMSTILIFIYNKDHASLNYFGTPSGDRVKKYSLKFAYRKLDI
jgi:hypothetical protein